MKVTYEDKIALDIKPTSTIFYRALFVDLYGSDCFTSIRFNSIKDLEDHYLYLCDNPDFLGVLKFED